MFSRLFKRSNNEKPSTNVEQSQESLNSTTSKPDETPSTPIEDTYRQVTLLVIGAGNRGNMYSQYAKEFPNRLKIIGVAEPREARRKMFQKNFNISDEYVFNDWKDAAKLERF